MKKEKSNAKPERTEDLEEISEELSEEVLAEARAEASEAAEDPQVLLQKKNDELLDKLQRTLAEFDNFRKRTAKEKTSMMDDGVRDTVLKLLPVVDNFARAVASATDKEDGFFKGVDMIYRQLLITLDEIGVSELPGVGEPFDPNVHSAVAHIEDPELGENVVADVLQKGYAYKQKVIRPSMVKVAN